MERLLEYGVEKDRRQFKGWGERRPKADNDTAAGRKENRRVEFLILNVSDEFKRKLPERKPVDPSIKECTGR